MIKPDTVKIITYNAAKGKHTMWYILPGNGGDGLNAKNRRLIPTTSAEISDTNIGGLNRLSKEFALVCKKSYHNYRRSR